MSAKGVAQKAKTFLASQSSGRAALLPAKTQEQLKEDNPRVKQLYRAGLPTAAWELVNIFSNRPVVPNQHAPTESRLSANLDDRIAASNASIDAALGRKLKEPKNETAWVIQRRGQHVPTGMLARDLKNRFWHRMFKGSRDAAQAINDKGKNKGAEEEAK